MISFKKYYVLKEGGILDWLFKAGRKVTPKPLRPDSPPPPVEHSPLKRTDWFGKKYPDGGKPGLATRNAPGNRRAPAGEVPAFKLQRPIGPARPHVVGQPAEPAKPFTGMDKKGVDTDPGDGNFPGSTSSYEGPKVRPKNKSWLDDDTLPTLPLKVLDDLDFDSNLSFRQIQAVENKVAKHYIEAFGMDSRKAQILANKQIGDLFVDRKQFDTGYNQYSAYYKRLLAGDADRTLATTGDMRRLAKIKNQLGEQGATNADLTSNFLAQWQGASGGALLPLFGVLTGLSLIEFSNRYADDKKLNTIMFFGDDGNPKMHPKPSDLNLKAIGDKPEWGAFYFPAPGGDGALTGWYKTDWDANPKTGIPPVIAKRIKQLQLKHKLVGGGTENESLENSDGESPFGPTGD